MKLSWFVSVAPGLEEVLCAELAELALKARAQPGGVEVRGDLSAGWRIALGSRIAGRLALHVGSARGASPQALTGAVRGMQWAQWVHPAQRVEVQSAGKVQRFRKDQLEAAVRRGIEASLKGPRLPGRRPPRNPAVVRAVLTDKGVELSLDASGELLHRRGWRKATGKAPLRENLAAAVLRLAGWTPEEPLVDPMCGSGTFPIEAACVAEGVLPGGRRSFAFEDWPGHDPRAFGALKKKLGSRGRARVTILGADRNEGAVKAARSNLDRAGVGRAVQLLTCDVRALEPPAGVGLLVCNPPWGLRVQDRGARGAWVALGEAARARFSGWRIALIGPDADLARATGLSLESAATFPSGGQRLTAWIGRIP